MNIMEHSSLAGRLKHVAATSGGEYAGPCPRCGGEDRFRVWPDNGTTGRFMCRRCGWQGDGIQFVRDMSGLSYSEACRVVGGKPDKKRKMSGHVWEPKPSALPCDVWMAAAEAFVAHSVDAMSDSEEGQAYAKSRGLTPATIKALRIGWNPRDLYQDRQAWGLPTEVHHTTGKPRRVWLPSGLVLPTIRKGKVVAVKIRRDMWTPQDTWPKYAVVSGSCPAPMILSPKKGKPCVVVEGELDAILIAQEARDIVTAIAMRTANGRPDTFSNVLLMSGPVLVALDKDGAGADGAKWWRKHFKNAKRWPVPVGKDVGDLAGTPGLVRAWIEAGISAPKAFVPIPPVSADETPLRDPVRLAGGEPCPYSEEQLADFAMSHPGLICCPATRPHSWWWRDRTWCPQCKTPCLLGVTHEQ